MVKLIFSRKYQIYLNYKSRHKKIYHQKYNKNNMILSNKYLKDIIINLQTKKEKDSIHHKNHQIYNMKDSLRCYQFYFKLIITTIAKLIFIKKISF